VNDALDRNDVDLNRVSTAHDRAPHFLETLADLLERIVARHERAVVLVVHGWNVVQPVVDLGIGYRPGRHAPGTPPGPTASPAFVAGAVLPLVRALEARGIAAPLGARYPARGRENLLQLFTARYLDDARPLVRRLAALGRVCDGVQLELGLPLRWPGAWRTRLVEAIVECVPALLGRVAGPGTSPVPAPRDPTASIRARSLEFASDGRCGLMAIDRVGARHLLFGERDQLLLFTGERTGGERMGQVGGLSFGRDEHGRHRLRYDGPLLRFPDTRPFLDLEHGLGRSALASAVLALDYVPAHEGTCPFGSVTGELAVDGRTERIRATATLDQADVSGQAMERLALALGDGERLLVWADDGARPTGFLCREGEHLPVDDAVLGADAAGGDLDLEIRLAGGARRTLAATLVHRLPVVRGGSVPPVYVEFGACRLAGRTGAAGWRFTRRASPAA
jgi:hypothetical protein